MTSLIMLALIVFGVVSYPFLAVSTMPVIQFPTIQVSTSYPGADPDTIAKRISSPLERQLMITQGIKLVTSMNTYENSQIICQFHLDYDINVAAQNVQEAIDKALAELPPDLPQNPTYEKTNPTDTPVTYIVFFSDSMPTSMLYDYGFNFVGQQLGTVEGIANITTYGFPYAVRAEVDPQLLAAKQISMVDLKEAIHAANPQKPTGKLYNSMQSMPVNSLGELTKADLYNDVIIKFVDGMPVRLGDVGKAYDSVQNNKELFQWVTKENPQGDGAFFFAIYREQGYNTFKVCSDVEALVEKLRPQLPRGMQMVIPYSQSKFIEEAIDDVELTLLVAFLLVVLVVFFYLGKVRNSIIPLITLPITVTGTLIMMYLVGYSINILTASALTISIGFLVDDAIVVLENIVRWVQKKKKAPYEAAVIGSRQIIVTVVSISLCLAAVFIPLMILQGVIGSLFHEFAGVVLIAILFSGFISLALTPMLCSRFVPPYHVEKKGWLERLSDKLNEVMLKVYKPALLFSVRHKFTILVCALGSIVASAFLFVTLPREFLPENDLGVIQCFGLSQEGTSPIRMNEYLNGVAKIAMKHDFVHTVGRIESTPTDNQSIFFLNLVDIKDRPSVWECMKILRPEFEELVGIKVFMKPFPLINLQVGSVQSGKSRYQYTLQSFSQEKLFKTAEEMIAKFRNNENLIDVSSDFQPYSPTINLDLLRDQAWSYGGLNATDIENALMYAYGETYISKINVPQDMYYVILEVANQFQKTRVNFQELYVGEGENQVNLTSVINSSIVAQPSTINHINALPAVTIGFDVAPGVPLSTALASIETIAEETVPESVMKGFAGNTEAFEEASKQFALLFIFAIFAIYIILGILYENFIIPITPLMAIPIAALGALLTLLVLGQALSIYALIGMIMLLGIVMKNGILMVDFAVAEMAEGRELHDAIIDACLIRFRPIIMTTLAAMMGAVPIALGLGGSINAGRAPLGQVIVGGLIFSQAVTLLVTPVFFIYIAELNDYFKRKFQLFQEQDEGS